MGGIAQGAAVCRVDEAGVMEGPCEHVTCDVGAEPAVLGADPALEQQRGGRQPDVLVPVICGDARHFPGAAADAADNGGKNIG